MKNKTALIGDVGSTSADWALVEHRNLTQFSTRGFNPTAHDPSELQQMLDEAVMHFKVGSKPEVLHYYGTGVNNKDSRRLLVESFKSVDSLININVQSDILGAARAVCQGHPGVVAILGSGSNACRYSNHQIQERAVNLGYMLADEGSGYDIGSRLVTSYYYDKIPSSLRNLLSPDLPSDHAELVGTLYAHQAPNRYLASFARLAIEHRDHEFVRSIVRSSFQSFIYSHKIICESSQKIHFVGSIAYYFCSILAEELSAAGLKLGTVVQKPIEHLIKYHQHY